jgi:hypothetical protein
MAAATISIRNASLIPPPGQPDDLVLYCFKIDHVCLFVPIQQSRGIALYNVNLIDDLCNFQVPVMNLHYFAFVGTKHGN